MIGVSVGWMQIMRNMVRYECYSDWSPVGADLFLKSIDINRGEDPHVLILYPFSLTEVQQTARVENTKQFD